MKSTLIAKLVIQCISGHAAPDVFAINKRLEYNA